MASPHVAGAVALLKQARPTLAASAFRDILQNSADPAVWSGSPGLGLLDIVHRQGAGMLDIDDAIASTTTISPGKLSLGEGTGGTATLTLRNSGSSAGHVQPLGRGRDLDRRPDVRAARGRLLAAGDLGDVHLAERHGSGGRQRDRGSHDHG